MNVAVVHRHPAMRAGIESILERAPGVRVVAAAAPDLAEISHALYATVPDVVIVEDSPGRADGVDLARRIKWAGPGPRVLLYADRPDAVQVAAAMLADADGLIDSAAPARELVEAVRAVAAGEVAFPDLGARERRELARRLPAEDHAILAMRLSSTPGRDIAETLRIDTRALRRRVAAMIGRLREGAAAGLRSPAPDPA